MTNKVIIQDTQEPEAPLPERRMAPEVAIPYRHNPMTSRALARAVAGTLGKDSEEERMKQDVDRTGNVPEWQEHRTQVQLDEQAQRTKQAVQNTLDTSEQLGLDPAAELQGTGVGVYDIEKARRDEGVEFIDKHPETDGFIRSTQKKGITRVKDVEDYEARYTFRPEQIAAQHRTEIQEAQTLAFKMMEEEADSRGFAAGSIPEIVAGFVQSFIPFLEPAGRATAKLVLDNDGEWYSLHPGQIQVDFAKQFAAMAQEDRIAWLNKVIPMIYANPVATDFMNQMWLADVIGSDRQLKGEGLTEHSTMDMIDNVVLFIEGAMAVKYMVNMLNGGIAGANPILSLGKLSNKEAMSTDMAGIVTSLDKTKSLEEWGITAEHVGRTQLPGHKAASAIIEDVPDDVMSEADRIIALREDTFDLTQRQRSTVYETDDVVTAAERLVEETETLWGGQVRPGRSQIAVHEDGAGLRFSTTLGKNERSGFRSERTAFEQAEELEAQGYQTRVFIVENGKLKPYMSADESRAKLSAIRDKAARSTRGEYYVQYDFDYFMRPTDRALFGEEMVVAPTWLGRAGRWLLSPTAQLNPKFVNPYINNFLGENAIAASLQTITAPIFQMKRATRRNIDKMYSYTEEFARENKRAPNMHEYKEMFPDAGSDEYRGLYLMKQFYNTIYDVNNETLYREWNSKGFQTLRSLDGTGATYHGKPLSPELASSKGRTVWNPGKQKLETLTKEQVNTLYANGGNILEAELTITAGEGKYATHIISDPLDPNWKVGKLSEYPLEYIEGYWPRVYEDYYVIEKTIANATVNGKPKKGGHKQVIAISGTKADADKFAAKAALNDPENTYIPRDVSRMSDKDRTAMDRQRMQLEGRLFYDTRNDRPLPNVTGGFATVISPTNMLQRTSRIVARHTATEELLGGMKTSWNAQYGHLVGNIDRTHTSAISAELTKVVRTGTTAERKLANEALATWDYMRVIEGSINEGSTWFRQRSIAAAEWLHETLSGVPGASRATTYMFRNAHRVSPVEDMKHLAFTDFLVTRPVRQLVLQSSQHMFLQALDPLYAGKWQLHTALLRQGSKQRAHGLLGIDHKDVVARNAKIWGISEQEYHTLVREFDKSGIAQAVNAHSYAGNKVRLSETPASAAGDIAQTTGRTATLAPVREALQKYGFDAGEEINVTASWLMAMRRHMKEKGIEDISKLKEGDWTEIGTRGSNYALAMHRANASKYQYGLASLATQFLSFSHKTFLTMLRGGVPVPFADKIPGIKKVDKALSSMGNKAFTRAEARNLVAGQLVLFGGAGFGFKPEVERLFTEYGLEQYVGTEIADLVAGGLLDYVIDNSLQILFDDPEMDFPFDEFAAPGANTINIVRNFYDLGTETPIIEGLAGPSGNTFSRIWDGFRMARLIVNIEDDLDPLDRATMIADHVARGVASGWSDFAKARLAANYGRFLSRSGQLSAVDASWQEIMAKGLLGLNSERTNDAWRTSKSAKDDKQELDKAAKDYFFLIKRYTSEYSGGTMTKEAYADTIRGLKVTLQMAFDKNEWHYIVEEFNRLNKFNAEARKGVGDMLAESIIRGVPHSQYNVEQAISMGMSEDDAKALTQLWEEQTRQAELSAESMQEVLNKQIEAIED